jgi:hypothetical protein
MWDIDDSGERFCKELGDVVRKHRKGKFKWERLLIALGREVDDAEARLQTILTHQDQQKLRRRMKEAMRELDLRPTHATSINIEQEERYLDRRAKDLLGDLRKLEHSEYTTIVKVMEDAVTLYTELRRFVGRKIIVLTGKIPGSRPEALMNGGNLKRFLKQLNEIAEILKIVIPQE